MLPIPRNFPQVLAPAAQSYFLLPDSQDVCELSVHRRVFVEEVSVARAKCPKHATEQRFTDVAVIIPGAIEALLSAVIDTGNTEGRGVQRQGVEEQFFSSIVGTEASFVRSFAHLVVIVEQCDNFVPEPDMRLLLHQQRIAEQAKIVTGIAVSLYEVFELIGDIVNP